MQFNACAPAFVPTSPLLPPTTRHPVITTSPPAWLVGSFYDVFSNGGLGDGRRDEDANCLSVAATDADGDVLASSDPAIAAVAAVAAACAVGDAPIDAATGAVDDALPRLHRAQKTSLKLAFEYFGTHVAVQDAVARANSMLATWRRQDKAVFGRIDDLGAAARFVQAKVRGNACAGIRAEDGTAAGRRASNGVWDALPDGRVMFTRDASTGRRMMP